MFDFIIKVYNFNVVVVVVDFCNIEVFVKLLCGMLDLEWWCYIYFGEVGLLFIKRFEGEMLVMEVDDDDDLVFNLYFGIIIGFESFLIFEGFFFN